MELIRSLQVGVPKGDGEGGELVSEERGVLGNILSSWKRGYRDSLQKMLRVKSSRSAHI